MQMFRPIKLNEFYFSNAWTCPNECPDVTPANNDGKEEKNEKQKYSIVVRNEEKSNWMRCHCQCAPASQSAAIKRYSIFIGEIC